MTNNNFYVNCKSIEEAKKLRNQLIMECHSDINNTDDEKAKKVNADFDIFCKEFVQGAFNNDERSQGQSVDIFTEILKKACTYNIRIEIIGYWIYCFESYEVRESLKNLGLWFSKKHKAWVYSGGKKRLVKSRYSTQGLRNKWGSQKVRDKEENKKLVA